MGIARSTFYDLPTAVHDDTAIVEAIAAICDEGVVKVTVVRRLVGHMPSFK